MYNLQLFQLVMKVHFRPEVSQCYTFESNKYRGAKPSVLFKSIGTMAEDRCPVVIAAPDTTHHPTVQQNLESPVHISPYLGSSSTVNATSSRLRLSECLCYICKKRLGADHSKRIGDL